MEPRAGREAEQIDARGCDVLAHLACLHLKASLPQLVVQFCVDQMDLAQIGRGRVSRYPRAMLDGRTLMRVTFDTERMQHWLKVGAQPSDRVAKFLAQAEMMKPRERREQTKKNQPRAKAQERLKAAAGGEAAAEAPAAAPAAGAEGGEAKEAAAS